MIFSSSLFIVYFLPVFLLTYYICPRKYKNYVILLGSTFFYVWGAQKFVFVLFGSILLDFILAKKIHAAKGRRKEIFLIISVIINTSILLYFKYANFFVENVNVVLHSWGIESVAWTTVALPIGISFFTFHELSYIIDVYRGVKAPLRKITDYAVYILLFPQLIAGPIIRFNEIADQIQNRDNQLNADNGIIGFFRFAIGLAKKVLIANTLGQEADRIFNLPDKEIDFATSWIGAIAYTFQIYFDFSGYSDMAIGLARMMGFIFPENFNNPYISQSITEFWRRWHISLSRWMRDYLYIPLGGSRVSATRLYINLWIVFLISGFWHGAEWTFIFWGAYHGLFLVLERLFLNKILEKLFKPLRILYSFLVVVIGWVFFRSDSIAQSFHFIQHMFSFNSIVYFETDSKLLFYLIVASIIVFVAAIAKVEALEERVYIFRNNAINVYGYIISAIILVIICLGYITSTNFNPFIYFRF